QDGEIRLNRSEAREADVLIMVAILFHTDLASLRVATPKRGGEFINRSCAELSKCIGMYDATGNRPSRKFQRGFARLQSAGILTSVAVSGTNKAGEVRKRNSAKAISEEFLAAVLGGSNAALRKVKAARIGHSKATRHKRGPVKPKPTSDALVALNAKAAAVKVRKAAKRLESEGVAVEAAAQAAMMMSPEGKAKAYQRARGAYQRDLLNKGHTDFKEVHALMSAFPTIENWHP
ncbi:MAG: hypothetical protein ACRDC7_09760, partial [Aeromonas veronii]